MRLKNVPIICKNIALLTTLSTIWSGCILDVGEMIVRRCAGIVGDHGRFDNTYVVENAHLDYYMLKGDVLCDSRRTDASDDTESALEDSVPGVDGQVDSYPAITTISRLARALYIALFTSPQYEFLLSDPHCPNPTGPLYKHLLLKINERCYPIAWVEELLRAQAVLDHSGQPIVLKPDVDSTGRGLSLVTDFGEFTDIVKGVLSGEDTSGALYIQLVPQQDHVDFLKSYQLEKDKFVVVQSLKYFLKQAPFQVATKPSSITVCGQRAFLAFNNGWVILLEGPNVFLEFSNENAYTHCCVCYGSFADEEDVSNFGALSKLGCGHIYHHPCITEWHKVAQLCPYCKEQFDII